MIVLDTAFHLTFDGKNTKPELACLGNCKKVWWQSDLENRPENTCPLCGHQGLTKAIEKVHYKILTSANRPLRLSDFTDFTKVTHKDKQFVKGFLANGGGIDNLSIVKPAFIEKAKAEWCS